MARLGVSHMPAGLNAVSQDHTLVAEYRRTIAASLERVWENVLDWEHLPFVHAASFLDIEVEDSGAWGWRARVGLPPASERREIRIELLTERSAGRYVTRTLEGVGSGTEIWTRLDPVSPEETDIVVEFHVPDVPPDAADSLGRAYLELYARLWSEDESMMRERQAAIVARRANSSPHSSRESLGGLEALRATLPKLVRFRDISLWIYEQSGTLVTWSALCPHRLGPLGEGTVKEGVVTCPWHGYRFDLATGQGCDGRSLGLVPGPEIRVEDGEVWLVEEEVG